MKTWVDLQELYWLLQELRLRRSLQGGAANAQGDLIAAKPLADYSPEVPSPRIDDGINTAEMQDLERIAEQTREPLDHMISARLE